MRLGCAYLLEIHFHYSLFFWPFYNISEEGFIKSLFFNNFKNKLLFSYSYFDKVNSGGLSNIKIN